jgi:tRNA-specific 2-thiouridylase
MSIQTKPLNMPESGKTVVVGMSGGVDSTVVALLLKERGCRVVGVTMSSWNGDLPLPKNEAGYRNSCYGPDEKLDIDACTLFCKEHDIEYHVIDVREAYQREVLDYFKNEYRSGRTPNPCIRCNPQVKFGALLDGVRKLGIDFDYFCTGHYASLIRPENSITSIYNENVETDNPHPVMISCANDISKDQAYFLYRIPTEVLEKVRFPLGNMTKSSVFELALSKKLVAASRSESQDFVPPEYFDIIFSDKPSIPGDIVDLDGHVLGKHRGIEHYTIGQRRGLGVSSTKPLYVHSIDTQRNRVVLADYNDLLVDGLIANDWVWAGNYAPKKTFKAMVKIRLASKPVEAEISPLDDGEYIIIFEKQQRAVAPGQSAVVYLEGIILGGGIISQAI